MKSLNMPAGVPGDKFVNDPAVSVSVATPTFWAESVWKFVPPGFAYMSPSSAFGSGFGFGIVTMSGWQDSALSTSRERAAPEAPAQWAPLSLLVLGAVPPCDAVDQNAVFW